MPRPPPPPKPRPPEPRVLVDDLPGWDASMVLLNCGAWLTVFLAGVALYLKHGG